MWLALLKMKVYQGNNHERRLYFIENLLSKMSMGVHQYTALKKYPIPTNHSMIYSHQHYSNIFTSPWFSQSTHVAYDNPYHTSLSAIFYPSPFTFTHQNNLKPHTLHKYKVLKTSTNIRCMCSPSHTHTCPSPQFPMWTTSCILVHNLGPSTFTANKTKQCPCQKIGSRLHVICPHQNGKAKRPCPKMSVRNQSCPGADVHMWSDSRMSPGTSLTVAITFQTVDSWMEQERRFQL